MNSENFNVTKRAVNAVNADLGAADADESKAGRLVRAAVALRILIPTALITVIIASAHWKDPDSVVGGNVAAASRPSAILVASAADYFPGNYVNQARHAEAHVQNF